MNIFTMMAIYDAFCDMDSLMMDLAIVLVENATKGSARATLIEELQTALRSNGRTPPAGHTLATVIDMCLWAQEAKYRW